MSTRDRWLNVIGYVLVIAINVWVSIMPFGGKTTGEISDKYHTLITPAGYAFSIWSLIYFTLLLFIIYSFTKQGQSSPALQKIGYYFFLTCIFNIAWLVTWQLELLMLSVLVMICLLITLIIIYTRLNHPEHEPFTGKERYLVTLPFSLYIGWICVALVVNISATLTASNWNGFGLADKNWAIIMLLIASVIALVLGLKYKDAAVMLVFVWAFIAIAIEQQAYQSIAIIGFVFAGLLLFNAIFLIVKHRRL